MTLTFVLLVIVALITVFVVFDFIRFNRSRNKEKATSAACHSGGTFIIDSNKTYYVMPNGERRKWADYPMDLNPKSADMALSAKIMEQAYREHELEKIKTMQAVAKEVTE